MGGGGGGWWVWQLNVIFQVIGTPTAEEVWTPLRGYYKPIVGPL